MKQQFVFPAVLYYDEDNLNYAVAFYDIDVFTEGTTVEDAFKSAKDYLEAYIKFSMHLNDDVDIATSYVVVKEEHENDIVLLVDAEVDPKENEKNFDNDIFDD